LTLVVLRQLDGRGRGEVAQFLADSKLIEKGAFIVDLSGANLRGAKLANAYLTGTEFHGDLRGADLHGATLDETDFTYTNLRGADLRDAIVDGADFSSSNLRAADFSGAGYAGDAGADFSKTCLAAARFTGALLPNSKFRGAEGRSVDFSRASFEDADFAGAAITDVIANDTTYGAATEKTFPENWGPHGVPRKPYAEDGPCKRKVPTAP